MSRRILVALAVLFAGLFLFGAGWLGRELFRPLPPTPPYPVNTGPTPVGGSNGLIAFVSERDGLPEIYVMNPDGSDQRNLTRNEAVDAAPVWSPDGNRIAFLSDRTGEFQLYVINLEGAQSPTIQQLTHLSGIMPPDSAGPLQWSPDGRQMVIYRVKEDEGGSTRLYLVNLADSSGVFLLQDTEGNSDMNAAWSPDGKQMAFQRFDQRASWLYLADVSSGEARPVERNSGWASDWSPDSARLAFVVGSTVRVLDLRDQSTRIIQDLPRSGFVSRIAWSPDGARLAVSYFSNIDSVESLYLFWSDGSGLTQLTHPVLQDMTRSTGPVWSSDSRWLAFYTESLAPMPTAGVVYETTTLRSIYVINVEQAYSHPDSLQPVPLTTTGKDYGPQWQP